MNLRAIVQKIKSSFNHREEFPNETVLGFLHVLESVREEECSCDEITTGRQTSRRQSPEPVEGFEWNNNLFQENLRDVLAIIHARTIFLLRRLEPSIRFPQALWGKTTSRYTHNMGYKLD